MHIMTVSQSYKSTILQKYRGIDVDTVPAFQDMVLVATAGQQAHEVRELLPKSWKTRKSRWSQNLLLDTPHRIPLMRSPLFWPTPFWWQGPWWPKLSIPVWTRYTNRSRQKELRPLPNRLKTLSCPVIQTGVKEASRQWSMSSKISWHKSSMSAEIVFDDI